MYFFFFLAWARTGYRNRRAKQSAHRSSTQAGRRRLGFNPPRAPVFPAPHIHHAASDDAIHERIHDVIGQRIHDVIGQRTYDYVDEWGHGNINQWSYEDVYEWKHDGIYERSYEELDEW